MATPAITYSFTNGRESDATQVNQNFTDLVNALTDGAKTITIAALVSPLITSTKAVFNSQSAAYSSSTINALYVAGGDLYYNDKNGASIQLTAGGGINAVNQAIPGVVSPVSFAYSAGKFTAKSANTTFAKLEISDVLLYENTAGISNAVTLKSPTSLAASYSVIFPAAVPAAKRYVSMDATGALSNASTADTVAGEITTTGANAIASSVTATGANAIFGAVSTVQSTQANLAAVARTRVVKTDGTDPGVGGVVISPTCGAANTSASTITLVSNLSVTLSTSGRPVRVQLISDGDTTFGSAMGAYGPGTASNGLFQLLRGASILQVENINVTASATGGSLRIDVPVSSFGHTDVPASGVCTYTVRFRSITGSAVFCNYAKLVAYEL